MTLFDEDMMQSNRHLPPEELSESDRDREAATHFAHGILRLSKSQKRLAFSAPSSLTGGNQNETDRQSVTTTSPALTTTHP